MAPDLNSVPPSPRNLLSNNNASTPRGPSRQNSTGPGTTMATSQGASSGSANTSRRASQIFPMSPPPLPLASPGGAIPPAQQTPSHQHQPFPPLSPLITSGNSFGGSSGEGTGVPMRHPRPLTAAELHLELEKEQEAVVNRLTRELTALRAHSASVASTASSTSTAPNPSDAQSQSQYPTPARRHRSSSSVSRGSFSHAIPLNAATVGIPHYHRPSLSGTREGHAEAPAGPGISRTVSAASGVSTARYEEAAQARMELEEAKKENEALRQRVRELEGLLRGRREGTTESNVGGEAERGEGQSGEVTASGLSSG
ncbi:hypothetical protein NA57DRAFT_76735 [Rhizodiscina lignyota]|uniref:Uncharacterized protein n=1 Tax=Rhizodiscina lignyota TaxID=1504668 RepID=A0A9P4IES2_9PEZI|nr:hypothetical protein NA57DRAFT_76735 [Rhizodiscina lignyota]